MFRPLVQGARCAARAVAFSRPVIARPVTIKSIARSQFPAVSSVRWYAAAGGMSKQEVEGRILDLLKGFDKAR
ncbi:hypothetical protein FH972_022572 [Carpinus fangiana]|uniref:Uncharacterized protein n=1 Tax=Carpinus fangiana TaxID=176857 RepID=A0A5N6KSM4_9ROSI|nr:hypothetical protein FH972_022572 [Carpinus fangiana]